MSGASEAVDERSASDASDGLLAVPGVIEPSSYDYGNLSRGSPIIEPEALGRQRYPMAPSFHGSPS